LAGHPGTDEAGVNPEEVYRQILAEVGRRVHEFVKRLSTVPVTRKITKNEVGHFFR
jgi:hypothetical protein